MTDSQSKPAVRAVAFDLDGTLLDTLHDLAAAVNLCLAAHSLPTLSKDIIRPLIGKGSVNLVRCSLAIARGVPVESLSKSEVEDALQIFELEYSALLGRGTVLYPGAREGLRQMASMNLPLAVVTNKASRFVGPHLDQAGIAKYFLMSLGGDDLPTKKPDPGPLLHVAKTFGIMPGELLMVGDSESDVQAARSAGCPVVVLPYGYTAIAVENLKADAVLASIVDVADYVRSICAQSPGIEANKEKARIDSR